MRVDQQIFREAIFSSFGVDKSRTLQFIDEEVPFNVKFTLINLAVVNLIKQTGQLGIFFHCKRHHHLHLEI